MEPGLFISSSYCSSKVLSVVSCLLSGNLKIAASMKKRLSPHLHI